MFPPLLNTCLNKVQLEQLLSYAKGDAKYLEEEFLSLIQQAEEWAYEITGVSYLFAQILERRKKEHKPCAEIVEIYYQLNHKMRFTTQAFDDDYIEIMFRTLREKSLTLEEEIIRIQDILSNRRYHETLQF